MTVATGIISGVSIAHQHASVEQIEAACTRDERETVEALRLWQAATLGNAD